MKIFGVEINKYKKGILLNQCFNQLKYSHKKLFIATLNPEILLTARKNPDYKKILNSADIKIVDGFGIKLVSWLKKEEIGDRITGVDFSSALIKKANQLKLKIGIVYLKEGFSSEEEIKKSLKDIGRLKILGISKNEVKNANIKELNDCHLVLVAIGHPHQEILIYNNLFQLTQTRIIMGIGGTLDFWTKRKKRAPKIIRKIGFEWLWRLIVQPNRLPRIFNAVIKFPILAIMNNYE